MVPPIQCRESADEGLMKRILLAEDDNDMRQFLTRALKTAGYDVVSFDNDFSRFPGVRWVRPDQLLDDLA